MNALLLELGSPPARIAQRVLRRLPPPWAGGRVERARLDVTRFLDPGRNQVDAAQLIDALPDPPPGWVIVGIAGHDLFLPVLAYVSGLAPLGGRRGVTSTARLGVGTLPAATVERRLLIEVAHEGGHALGLVHCAVPHCVMHQSLSADELDLKDPAYCPACAATFGAAGR